MNYRIAGSLMIDGTGRAPERVDFSLREGRVCFDPVRGDEHIIDARGLCSAPGFIDTHRHADFAAINDAGFGAPELAQGITSALCGNCGLSPVPNAPETRARWFSYLSPCLGEVGAFEHARFDEYLYALQRTRLPINLGALCGTGAVTVCAKGFSSEPMDARQLSRAMRLVDEAFDAGAMGLSTGLLYEPECHTRRDELVKIVARAARRDAVWAVHLRVEGDGLEKAVDEAIGIAGDAGARLNISHFKATGSRNWNGAIFRSIDRIEKARAAGMEVTLDFYPYTRGATTILSLFPPGFSPAGKDPEVELIRLKAAIDAQPDGWDDQSELLGWDRITASGLSGGVNKALEGLTIAEITEQLGYEDGWLSVLRLAMEPETKPGILLHSMSGEDIKAVAALPYAALISDALYGGCVHPRRHGAFPRFIRQFALEQHNLTLEAAIHKMTGMPARRYQMHDRGLLAEGYFADVCLFDAERLTDRATYADAKRLAEGMRYVFVNGRLAWDGAGIVEKAGDLLRGNG